MWRFQRVPRRELVPSQAAGMPTRGVCAHRGGAGDRPENTLAAFRNAGQVGVHQVEFDVRQTADGKLVVIHDAEVNRTTNGCGRVRDFMFEELHRLDAGSWWERGFTSEPRFASERVPTLAEVLSSLPLDVWINVQIKRGEPVARDTARAVLEAGRRDQTILSCGNQDARIARSVDPKLRVCNLARQRSRAAYVEHAIATGAHFIQFHHLRGPMEPDLAKRAHRAGMRINFFCSPNPTIVELTSLFEAGVDFLLVDNLEQGLEAAQRVGIGPLPRRSEGAAPRPAMQPVSGTA